MKRDKTSDPSFEKTKPQIEQLAHLIRKAVAQVWEGSQATDPEKASGTLTGLVEGVSSVLLCMDKATGTIDTKVAYNFFRKSLANYCEALYEALYMENETDTNVN